MKSKEIRKQFLEYFKANGHEIIHSGPLVPHNDPTLMFANSGMVQFKNVFTGKEKRDYLRATTSQKCVRAGGKHNDLEQVGYTTRHHTFFEMLGNFSFGDYFKDVAIELAWKLITKEFEINKNNLLVTVFNEDIDSYNFWKKISGLSDDKIIKISTSDNFWSMGETGPCGPCSEIFYDHGDKFSGGPPGSKEEDGDRFVEIWNLVFMQFEQVSQNNRINLPKPSIDTGMGLERITALLQNSNDNYTSDIFLPLINKSIDLTSSEKSKNSASHRVVADHLRSAAFLISDGVLPSSEGRGYVLRRIMRRGMRHAHSLGNKEPIFHKIFPVLLEEMGKSYPELERAKELINNILFNEESKFKQTIDHGLKILDEEIHNMSNNIFSGDIAFKLYDTFGFPIDLTQDYLKSKNIIVDVEQFDKKMKSQKEKARKSWKGIGEPSKENQWLEIINNLEPTEFLGYENNYAECLVLKIIKNYNEVNSLETNKEGYIILNQTPFYGESGGQIGDTGNIKNKNFTFNVLNTTKIYGKYYLHYGKVIKGTCKINDEVNALIDITKRNLIKNNHSSTHLLHAALRKILGNHVLQKGSLVNSEKLRFDFSHNVSINSETLKKIELLINKIIQQNNLINVKILDHQSAIDEGAMALFGEKYDDEVRVVTMGSLNNKFFSKELCGGTHVKRTGEIKEFKIINQSSVSSGVRRIEAISNIEIDTFKNTELITKQQNIEKKNKEINKYLNLLKKIDSSVIFNLSKYGNLNDKLLEVKKIYKETLYRNKIDSSKKNIVKEKIGKYNFIYLNAIEYPQNSFKSFIDSYKKNNVKSIITLVSSNKGKVSIIIGVTEDIINEFDARELVAISSKIVGGRGGGGRKDLAQAGGNNINKIEAIFDCIRTKISQLI